MLGFLFGAYIYNNMRHIKLKDLINEQHKNNSPLAHSLEKDLAYLQERLIEEGLWDTIKQKVSGALEKTGEKTKELLIKPLVKVILDKIAKDDPKGFAQIQQYAQKDPENIQKLLDHPSIKKQQNKVEKELGNIQETLTEEQAEDFLQEYMDAVLEEARVLKDDPRNVARRARYAKRKADRLAGGNAPTPPKDADTKKEEPSAGDNIKQGSKQLAKGLGQAADKAGIWAIEKGGDAIKGAANLIGKGMDTKVGQAAKGAVGGLISKVYGWVKKNPKLSAGIGLGLLGAIFTAASIGSGGIVPLITSTLTAAGGGAIKGGAIGGAIGAAKDAYGQIKGGKKSFKDMDYKQMAKSGLKAGGKGAAIGAAVGAGANVLGKAALGAKDIASGEYFKAKSGDSFLKDLTPGEKRNLGYNPDGSPPSKTKVGAGTPDPTMAKYKALKQLGLNNAPVENVNNGEFLIADKNGTKHLFDKFGREIVDQSRLQDALKLRKAIDADMLGFQQSAGSKGGSGTMGSGIVRQKYRGDF
jgi:hypothetical protein